MVSVVWISVVHAGDSEKVKLNKKDNEVEIRFSTEGKELGIVGDTVFVDYIETTGKNGKFRYVPKDALMRAALGVLAPRYKIKKGINSISLSSDEFSSIDFFEEQPSGERVRRVASGVKFSEAVSSADISLTVQLIASKDVEKKILINFENIEVIQSEGSE